MIVQKAKATVVINAMISGYANYFGRMSERERKGIRCTTIHCYGRMIKYCPGANFSKNTEPFSEQISRACRNLAIGPENRWPEAMFNDQEILAILCRRHSIPITLRLDAV